MTPSIAIQSGSIVYPPGTSRRRDRGRGAPRPPSTASGRSCSARLAILAVMLGGWEVAARTGVIDPFFFSMPSAIAVGSASW